MLRSDLKLSFDNFHILNHGRISKIEKDIDTLTVFGNTLDPPRNKIEGSVATLTFGSN